jgi:hypothetical protein
MTNTALRLVNQDHQTIFEALRYINPLNAELNPICHFLALLGNRPILHVSRIRVKIKRTEVAYHILCIFLLSGASCVLQSDNIPQYSTEFYKV